MASADLCASSLGQDLVAVISRLLQRGGVPNVLWGNYLLTVYGVPTVVSDAAFAVPDDKLESARQLLCGARLKTCLDTACVVKTGGACPAPAYHFHLKRHDSYISLFEQSQVLPNVSDLKSQVGIISASDESLPGPKIGFGNGAFFPRNKFVRIPSPACFTEACVLNFVKYSRQGNLWCPFDLHYVGWVTYMTEYVYPRGHLDVDQLSGPCRDFVVELFITEKISFIDARTKLLNSI